VRGNNKGKFIEEKSYTFPGGTTAEASEGLKGVGGEGGPPVGRKWLVK